jgi:flagellar motor switch protein FliN
MPALGPELSAQIAAVCRQNASEAAAALARGVETVVEIAVGEPQPLAAMRSALEGPGLALVFHMTGQGALALLPESCGLLPAWYEQPDATGQSRLATLAQELGVLLFPEPFAAGDSQAGHVPDLAKALTRGQPAESALCLPLSLATSTGVQGVLHLVWPAMYPEFVLRTDPTERQSPSPAPVPTVRKSRAADDATTSTDALPSYSRSLLRIRVPVSVTLASKKQPISRILELGQGSIVQFDKACDEPLELEVNGHKVAQGECVKVGDKFGLRITSIVLPDERFVALGQRRK